MPSVEAPKPLPPVISAANMKAYAPNDAVSRSYNSLISNAGGAQGLLNTGLSAKKTLLGGA